MAWIWCIDCWAGGIDDEVMGMEWSGETVYLTGMRNHHLQQINRKTACLILYIFMIDLGHILAM